MDKSYPKNKYCLSWKTHAKHVFKSLCCLMEHQSLVDIAICCGNKTLHAHKCILAANSHYFKDEMERNSAVEQIVITGFHFSVLKSIIEFMYCGETIINEEDVKYLIAASKVLQIRGLDTLFSDRQEYQHLADDVYIPYPQFISSKPKYPMAYHPPSNPSISNGASLKLPSYCITDPFNKKKLKRKYLRSEAEKACAKEAHASRMALAHLQKEIASTSQVNSFIIEESCTETTVENFIPHAEEVCMEASKSIEPVQIIDYTNPEQSFNSAVGNSKQNMLQFANIQNTPGYTSDKLKNIFEGESPANIEIIFKTSDGNFVTVNDEVLQNISKGGLQYQIVDENGHVSEIQDFKPLERSQTQQNLDMLKEFMKSTKISGNDVAQTVCENVNVSNEPTATESVNVIDDKTEISTVLPGGPEIDDDRKPIQFMLLDNGDFDSNMLAPFTQAIKICEEKRFPDCPELSRQVDVDEVSDFDHSTSCDKSSLKFSPDIFFADSTTGSVEYRQQSNNFVITPKNGTVVSKSHVVHYVQAIEKGTALLPCDLNPTKAGDHVVLVVWYKDEHTPIYSISGVPDSFTPYFRWGESVFNKNVVQYYDVRSPHTKQAKHWRGENLESRAFFRTMTEPATLSLDNVSEKDEAEYRCRIDYLQTATKNYRVKLNVIVPPQKPTIIDEKGKEVSGVAGPYEEGGDMKLTCIVTGGKPPPVVRWWRSGKLLESIDVASGFPNAQANQLVLRGLARSDLHSSFTCQASNNNMSLPLQSTTKIEMHFRPLAVEILSSNNPLSADRRYEIPCQSYGSRPSAKIVWLIEGKELRSPRYSYNQSESNNGNVTTSTLSFIPTRHENGLKLTCRAVNKLVRRGSVEATVKLNVFYIPLPVLTLGSNLNPDDIEEGDDVYFECKINANPWAYKVLWKHNDKIMQHNQKGRVIMSSSDLVLQGIMKNQMGNYSCVASNVEGDGASNNVNLKIMYKPICRGDQKRIYGVGKHETANIVCEVESYPPPDKFKWSFNNSAETIDVPQSRYHSESNRFSSTLTYTPITEMDYGSVMCWAMNIAGNQLEPCVFHIVTAGKPDTPFNCTIQNATSDSLEVNCLEGFDGGLPQFSVLEVYDQLTDVVQANVSSKFPSFTIDGLEAGKLLKIVIYAANARGRSDPVVLEGYTLNGAEKQTVLSLGVQNQLEIAPVLGILVGFVMMTFVLSIATLVYIKMRAYKRRKTSRRNVLRPAFLAVNSKPNPTPERRTENEEFIEKDEKNPDLIPTYRDSEHQLDSNACNFYVLSPQQNVVTPLTEAFLARDRTLEINRPNDEVTYAELALVRPSTLDTKNDLNKFGSLRRRDDQTIYAQIDHDRRGIPPSKPSLISPMISPVASMFPVNKPTQHHKEVVTIRAPLMGYQQESCV